MNNNDIVIDIVCPIYKHFDFVEGLYNSFLSQIGVKINKIVFAITESNDDNTQKTIEFAKSKGIDYFIVKESEFSHSLTREKAIVEYCESNIVVMISQDIKLVDDMVFLNLVSSIADGKTVFNYARQICKKRGIEKYIRQRNYPKKSRIIDKDNVKRLQIMAFFSSDACSAYDRETFIKLGGYGMDVMMSEDMVYSKKLLDAGYKKGYCANAVIEHSHNYTLKQIYNRYYDTGFFHEKTKLFSKYKINNSGIKLAFYVLGQAIIHFDIISIFKWLPDMSTRYLGMKNGKKAGKKA